MASQKTRTFCEEDDRCTCHCELNLSIFMFFLWYPIAGSSIFEQKCLFTSLTQDGITLKHKTA